MADHLGDAGGQPQKPPRFAPIFVAASLTGLYSQRSVFHDPSNVVTQRFYGGRPDTLWDGLNVELSNELTLIRRFGCSQFSGTTYPEAPTCGYSFELDDGSIQLMIDTPSYVYWDEQNGSKTVIFTKSAGAGQGYFVSSGNTLYYGDGVDLLKYTPGNPNGLVWNWGGVAPTVPPAITTVPSGSSAVAWNANTFFSTMGLISVAISAVDYTFQLTGVNANPASPNTTRIGESGTGQPAFATSDGGTTTDGSVTWFCADGPIGFWKANTSYAQFSCILDTVSGGVFYMAPTGSRTTGGSYPTFNTSSIGGATLDGGGQWRYLGGGGGGGPTPLPLWQPSTAYVKSFTSEYVTQSNQYIVTPMVPTAALIESGALIYIQFVQTGGTSNSSYTGPNWNIQAFGSNTQDNQLQWTYISTSTWAALTQVTAWQANQAVFTAIVDSNSNWQVCSVSGQTGGTAPTWGTVIGDVTTDNTAQWVCCGSASNSSWAASSLFYLPASGFQPPQSITDPFGGAEVIATASAVQYVFSVVQSGFSGASPPSWSAAQWSAGSTTTTDNGVLWANLGPYSAVSGSLTWQFGYTYAYSYEARTPTDPYNTTAPPGLTGALGPYKGSGTGVITTASPITVLSGAQLTGVVNNLTLTGSLDPQFDTIDIWRSADGGGSANMFLLTKIAMPAPLAPGQPGTVQFQDFLPDTPTSVYPGLNNLIPAPIDDSNDPPPAGFRPLCNKLHFSRIWGAVENTVFFSGGPDVLTGNPNEAFNPADDFPFESTVIACIHTPAGLICPTTTDFECIFGGPSTASFFDNTILLGVGMLTYNGWDIFGGEIYFVSSDSQLWTLNPALQLSRLGFPIGNKIAALNAAHVYLTIHESGTDNAIYLGDGSTGWYRLNPHQVGADIANENVAVWSPKATIAGGCQMLKSLVTAPGITNLLIGGSGGGSGSGSGGQHLQKRDTTVFSDSGTPYSSWLDIGAVTMVYPGQRAEVKFLECDFMPVGTQPLVSYVLDDPTSNPDWNLLTNYVFDPPVVYGGANITPNYWPDRFYLSQNADVAVGRRIRMKVDYGATDTVRNELISWAIFGRKIVE